MNMLVSISINLFPILMLLIIYANNHRKTAGTADKLLFDVLTLLAIGAMVSGTAGKGLLGVPGAAVKAGLWISYMVYASMMTGIAALWLLYICFRLQVWGAAGEESRTLRFLGVLQLLMTLLIVTTPWTHLLLFVTEDNICRHGGLYGLLYLECTLLILAGAVISIRKGRKENSRERKWECLYLSGCGFLLLAGMLIQYCFDVWWGGSSCLSLTLLFIYLNTQNRQITTDGLTGLNNRREFDKQILKWAEQNAGNWGMFMLDVDDFKGINDNLGHVVGDEALWETADILRRVLGRERTFLARYGGDEFAVIGAWKDEAEAKQALRLVEQEVDRFNRTAEKKYRLSFSIGYALWEETGEPDRLVALADERMYAAKTAKKRAAGQHIG